MDNQIQVKTNVETRVKPALTRVKHYLANTAQKLPIIGVALAVIVIFWLISRFVTHWDLPYQKLGLNRLLRNLIRQFLRKGIQRPTREHHYFLESFGGESNFK